MAVLVSNDQDLLLLLLLLLTFYDTQGVEQVIEPCYMLYRDGGTRRTTPPTVKINIYRGRKKNQSHTLSSLLSARSLASSSTGVRKLRGSKTRLIHRATRTSSKVRRRRKKKETSGGLMPC